MGQYYKIVNLDKKQYLDPCTAATGAKLTELGKERYSLMTGLSLLLADPGHGGGGDPNEESPLIGQWAGDRIVIVGDYIENNRHGVEGNLWYVARDSYENITPQVMELVGRVYESDIAYEEEMFGL
jgi:hypothetical protein